MDEKNSENINKTPEKMSRIAWPKSKYGVILAIILFVVVSLIYYKDKIINLFS
jgi:predicted 3-demethylubiquinone-9 3-methyltransferase (glyoxalase superfamily)